MSGSKRRPDLSSLSNHHVASILVLSVLPNSGEKMDIDGVNVAEPPPCFLIVYNVSKKHNVGMLARSAAAFGVKELCLVGSNKYNTFGSHGSTDFLTFKHFSTLTDCCTYLTYHHHCEIVGIEIDDTAEPVDAEPFHGPTAFLVGNEGTGLNAVQREVCDRLTYIPQFGAGTASLNVAVASSIVLHRFASWAKYRERSREGGKFDIGIRPMRRSARGVIPLTPDIGRHHHHHHHHNAPHSSIPDGYQSDCSNSDSASGYLSGIIP